MLHVEVLTLRPTQFAAGMREVQSKVEIINQLKHDELKDFFRDHAVPTVMAPDGAMYLVDHHHLVRAAWETGNKQVVVNVLKDLSHLSQPQFWETMKKENWVYLYDQFGKGPHEAEFLPFDVRGMADDPFRSLAWALREKKGFDKSPLPFSEFRWAEFLRKNLSYHPMKAGFHKALDEAMKLCHKPEAKSLPGYKENA